MNLEAVPSSLGEEYCLKQSQLGESLVQLQEGELLARLNGAWTVINWSTVKTT